MLKMIKSNEEFEESVKNGVNIVDFYADWCGPCRMLTPIMEELANKYESKINVLKVNVDNLPELAGKYNVSSIPLVLFFKDSEVKENILGYRPKEAFIKILEKLL